MIKVLQKSEFVLRTVLILTDITHTAAFRQTELCNVNLSSRPAHFPVASGYAFASTECVSYLQTSTFRLSETFCVFACAIPPALVK